MTLTLYTDGGSLNNPGQSAIAFVLYENNHLVQKYYQSIGTATNNIAEYSALIKGLDFIKAYLASSSSQPNELRVLADSELMVNQLTGIYRVKNKVLQKLFQQVKKLEEEIAIPISYQAIPREKNRLADSLVKKALIDFD